MSEDCGVFFFFFSFSFDNLKIVGLIIMCFLDENLLFVQICLLVFNAEKLNKKHRLYIC